MIRAFVAKEVLATQVIIYSKIFMDRHEYTNRYGFIFKILNSISTCVIYDSCIRGKGSTRYTSNNPQ